MTPPQPTPASATKEAQYEDCVALRDRQGLESLGLMSSHGWYEDPKRLAFLTSRYKFVAKMLSGRANVLEVGCADAFASRIVAQDVRKLTVTDFDPVFIADVNARMSDRWPMTAFVHDMLSGPVPPGGFDAAYSLDVLEHIEQRDEARFLVNFTASLADDAIAVIGMPSLESQAYASPISKLGHVNCKRGPELKTLLSAYFRFVFIFSMNDEVVHTGYYPMAQYLMGLCCGPIGDPTRT